MISVKLILDRRSQKQDGTYPLKLRIIHAGQTYHQKLGYSFKERDWDSKNQKVKSSCKSMGNTTRFNALLGKEKQKWLDGFSKLQEAGELTRLSFKEIKARISGNQQDCMCLAFCEEQIQQMKQAQKFGNARVYGLMLNSVRNFVKGKDFPLKQLNYKWLMRYEAWFLAKGNSINGLSVNMRTLRALMNRAIKEKRLGKDYYPFDEYKIKKEKTRKRAISRDDIEKLKNFKPQTSRQRKAKNYFMISFYLMGASFVDLAFLKVGDISNERVEYKRRKTGQLHSIAITKPLQALLEPYMKDKKKKGFLLDIIKTNEPEKQLVNVRDELRRYNRTLKEIGELCEIEAPLTSYVSRHSYATIAKYAGVPTAVISEALGHSSEEVTQIYLDSFDKSVLDKYHQMVIG